MPIENGYRSFDRTKSIKYSKLRHKNKVSDLEKNYACKIFLALLHWLQFKPDYFQDAFYHF